MAVRGVVHEVLTTMDGSANSENDLCDIDWLAMERRRQVFLDYYLLAVEACLRGGAREWWRHAFTYDGSSDHLANMGLLKEFCLRQVLYAAGDIWALGRIYEGLEREGIIAEDEPGRFLLDLTRYLRAKLAEVEPAPAGLFARAKRRVGREYQTRARKLPAVVSIVILDGVSGENFFDYCLASLASERNLKALAKQRSVRVHVFGRERDLGRFERRIAAASPNCTIVCEPIPEHLGVRAEGVPGPQVDWLIGALECLHILEAKRLRADFHAINPNALYADGYFEAISRLSDEGKQAVLAATLYADPDALKNTELAPFQAADGTITIPPVELATLGLRALVPGNGLKAVRYLGWRDGPGGHFQLAWERRDSLQIHSTHHEISFLSHRVLEALPDRFLMKPSAEIDKMLTGVARPHFVGEADRIVMLDLSNRKTMVDGETLDLGDFASTLASSVGKGTAAHFKQAVSFAIDRAALADRPWRGDDEFLTEKGAVFKALDEGETFAAPKGDQVLTALGVLHQYEVSEYGRDRLASVIAEGRRLLAALGTEADMDIAIRRGLIRGAMNFDAVDKALELAEGGGESTVFIKDFLSAMGKLKAENRVHAKRLRPAFGWRPVAVVGVIAWGERFVDKFMNYCLASLLAEGNIPALARKGRVVLSVVTTEADRDRMTAHPSFARLRQFAEVVFTCFPPEFLARREKDGFNFYHFYGLLDHQSFFLAAALRADLYLLPIDCVYSSRTLSNFSSRLERAADCCSIGAIEVEEAALRAWLDADGRRKPGGVLDLSGEALIQASALHPDRYYRAMIMNPHTTEFCAHPRELVWPFANGLGMHSVFMHPLAVSARLLTRPFHPHHENVDYALLPRLLQGDGRMAIIENGDEATLAHFGAPDTRSEFLQGGFSIRSFVEAHRYDYAVHRRFFETRQFFPCRELPYAPSTAYEADLGLIQSALKRNRFSADRT
jgi:hypothetical protein